MIQQTIQQNQEAIQKITKTIFPDYEPTFNTEDQQIEIGPFVLCPFLADVPAIGNRTRKTIKWQIVFLKNVPGQFNPYDGGTPPDVDEAEIGTFNNLPDALAEIAKIQAKDVIDGIFEEIDEEENQYEEMKKEQINKCPHGREFHECPLCLK